MLLLYSVYIRAAKMLVYDYNAKFVFRAGRGNGVLDPSWVDTPWALGGLTPLSQTLTVPW